MRGTPSMTAAMAIAYVGLLTEGKTTLNVNLIRVWAHRGHITRTGTDQWGYALYDIEEILEHIDKRVIAQQTDTV